MRSFNNKHQSEAYSEPYQTSKMKFFAKMVKGKKMVKELHLRCLAGS